MSRKFDRTKQIQLAAAEQLDYVRRHLFKPKPRWMPRFMWKLIVGMVIKQYDASRSSPKCSLPATKAKSSQFRSLSSLTW